MYQVNLTLICVGEDFCTLENIFYQKKIRIKLIELKINGNDCSPKQMVQVVMMLILERVICQ